MKPGKTICILPRLAGLGGPASFQMRLISGLAQRGVGVSHDPHAPGLAAILVIGGTSRLDDLWRARRRGVRIVQRLNGMNWIHRKRPTGWRHYLRSERNNWLLRVIRAHLADRIVYQSEFAQSWWRTVAGRSSASEQVIYNGVDLSLFNPVAPGGVSSAAPAGERPSGHYRLLLVEGHLGGGNEQGLENAVRLVQALNREGPRVELLVAADAPPALRRRFEGLPGAWLRWLGVVPREQIPALDRSAHVLFSADLNAACPNSVIEALACGLPVIAFATGSLPELLREDAGIVVPYGGNYWNLEPPDIPALAAAAEQVLAQQQHFRLNARLRAETTFGLDKMVESYMQSFD